MRAFSAMAALVGLATITVALWAMWWPLGLVFVGCLLLAVARGVDEERKNREFMHREIPTTTPTTPDHE